MYGTCKCRGMILWHGLGIHITPVKSRSFRPSPPGAHLQLLLQLFHSFLQRLLASNRGVQLPCNLGMLELQDQEHILRNQLRTTPCGCCMGQSRKGPATDSAACKIGSATCTSGTSALLPSKRTCAMARRLTESTYCCFTKSGSPASRFLRASSSSALAALAWVASLLAFFSCRTPSGYKGLTKVHEPLWARL